MIKHWKCGECYEITPDMQILVAASPFNSDDTIVGCPHCREVNTLKAACDEKNCTDFASCGTPTAEGYRWTCSKHKPTLS